jgi:hypothetical protein
MAPSKISAYDVWVAGDRKSPRTEHTPRRETCFAFSGSRTNAVT